MSPMLGPFDLDNNAKRAISVLDQDYDLMGLSQKNACDDESFLYGGMVPFEDDLQLDTVKKASQNLPVYMGNANNGFDCREDFLLEPVEEKLNDMALPDANFGLRNRS